MTSDRAGPPGDIWILKPMRGVGELLYYTHTDMIHAGESSPPELDLFQLLLCALRCLKYIYIYITEEARKLLCY